MNDAIREAFDLGKRFAAAYDAVDEAGMDRIEKEFSTLQSQTALSANGGEVAKSAAHSDYGYIPSKDHQWFFYDPEGDGMTFCKTEEEAFSGADQAIWQSLDECWSECVDQICYGKIVQAAAQVDRVDRPENVGADGYTPDGAHWPQDCEFMCNYRLESVTHPAPPSVAVPEGGRLVPVEPTTEMLGEGAIALFAQSREPLSSAYRSMLAAAPRCPMLTAAPSGDAKREAEELRKDAERYQWLRNRIFAADFDYGGLDAPCLIIAFPKGSIFTSDADATIDAARLRQSSDGDDSEEKAHG